MTLADRYEELQLQEKIAAAGVAVCKQMILDRLRMKGVECYGFESLEQHVVKSTMEEEEVEGGKRYTNKSEAKSIREWLQ
jgi:hypothetical protein